MVQLSTWDATITRVEFQMIIEGGWGRTPTAAPVTAKLRPARHEPEPEPVEPEPVPQEQPEQPEEEDGADKPGI